MHSYGEEGRVASSKVSKSVIQSSDMYYAPSAHVDLLYILSDLRNSHRRETHQPYPIDAGNCTSRFLVGTRLGSMIAFLADSVCQLIFRTLA